MPRTLYVEVTNTSGSSKTISDGIGSQYTVLEDTGVTAYRTLNSVTLNAGVTRRFLWEGTTPWSFERGSMRTLANASQVSLYVRKDTSRLGVPYGILRIPVIPSGGDSIQEPFWLPEDMTIDEITVQTTVTPTTAGTFSLGLSITGGNIATFDLKTLTANTPKRVPCTDTTHFRNEQGILEIASSSGDLVAGTVIVQIRYLPKTKNSDFFVGSSYLYFPNSEGSYAKTANGNAAAMVFPGGNLPDFTIGGWWYRAADGEDTDGDKLFEVALAASANPRLEAIVRTGGGIDWNLYNDAGVLVAHANTPDPNFGGDYANTWRSVLVVFDTGTNRLKVYLDGSLVVNEVRAGVDAFSLADTISFGASKDGSRATGILMRNMAVWGWALTASDAASLYLAGPWHDLRLAIANYAGVDSNKDPEHWWPADDDFSTTVTDRGNVGGCNLTLYSSASVGILSQGQ